MVRLIIAQDFQVVLPSVLSASTDVSDEGDIQQTRSVDHRFFVFPSDSQRDTTDVKSYHSNAYQSTSVH